MLSSLDVAAARRELRGCARELENRCLNLAARWALTLVVDTSDDDELEADGAEDAAGGARLPAYLDLARTMIASREFMRASHVVETSHRRRGAGGDANTDVATMSPLSFFLKHYALFLVRPLSFIGAGD